MCIRVPKSDLCICGSRFTIRFKLADSVQEESNIMDYYVSGDVLPLGRLAYIYEA